jgi:hypothetical protein
MKIINDFLESFNNKAETGMSGRKLTAFWFSILATYVHVKYLNADNALNFLITDCCVLLLALAIILPDHLIKLKNGSKTEDK